MAGQGNSHLYSPFHIVHAPYAIATPAKIFASGAMNRTKSPNAMQTPPSHVVLSSNLFFTHDIKFINHSHSLTRNNTPSKL